MSASLEKAREILQKINYITLATIDQAGEPWNAPVFGTADEDFNFYWGSYQDSQHSRNIRQNGKVYIAVYDSTVPPGSGEGVYARCTAKEITDPQKVKSIRDWLNKRHDNSFWRLESLQENGPIRLYEAIPQHVWMNDDGLLGGTSIDIRTQIK